MGAKIKYDSWHLSLLVVNWFKLIKNVYSNEKTLAEYDTFYYDILLKLLTCPVIFLFLVCLWQSGTKKLNGILGKCFVLTENDTSHTLTNAEFFSALPGVTILSTDTTFKNQVSPVCKLTSGC